MLEIVLNVLCLLNSYLFSVVEINVLHTLFRCMFFLYLTVWYFTDSVNELLYLYASPIKMKGEWAWLY